MRYWGCTLCHFTKNKLGKLACENCGIKRLKPKHGLYFEGNFYCCSIIWKQSTSYVSIYRSFPFFNWLGSSAISLESVNVIEEIQHILSSILFCDLAQEGRKIPLVSPSVRDDERSTDLFTSVRQTGLNLAYDANIGHFIHIDQVRDVGHDLIIRDLSYVKLMEKEKAEMEKIVDETIRRKQHGDTSYQIRLHTKRTDELKGKLPCALCCFPFHQSQLTGIVTYRTVLKWLMKRNYFKKDSSKYNINNMYNSVRICTFCTQFFDVNFGSVLDHESKETKAVLSELMESKNIMNKLDDDSPTAQLLHEITLSDLRIRSMQPILNHTLSDKELHNERQQRTSILKGLLELRHKEQLENALFLREEAKRRRDRKLLRRTESEHKEKAKTRRGSLFSQRSMSFDEDYQEMHENDVSERFHRKSHSLTQNNDARLPPIIEGGKLKTTTSVHNFILQNIVGVSKLKNKIRVCLPSTKECNVNDGNSHKNVKPQWQDVPVGIGVSFDIFNEANRNNAVLKNSCTSVVDVKQIYSTVKPNLPKCKTTKRMENLHSKSRQRIKKMVIANSTNDIFTLNVEKSLSLLSKSVVNKKATTTQFDYQKSSSDSKFTLKTDVKKQFTNFVPTKIGNLGQIPQLNSTSTNEELETGCQFSCSDICVAIASVKTMSFSPNELYSDDNQITQEDVETPIKWSKYETTFDANEESLDSDNYNIPEMKDVMGILSSSLAASSKNALENCEMMCCQKNSDSLSDHSRPASKKSRPCSGQSEGIQLVSGNTLSFTTPPSSSNQKPRKCTVHFISTTGQLQHQPRKISLPANVVLLRTESLDVPNEIVQQTRTEENSESEFRRPLTKLPKLQRKIEGAPTMLEYRMMKLNGEIKKADLSVNQKYDDSFESFAKKLLLKKSKRCKLTQK